MKNKIKNGFTFAELMISLVVIAVITAILYPTISELAPNNNKHLFRSAYKTIELIISDITNTKTLPTTTTDLCKEFSERLNVTTPTANTCQSTETTEGENSNKKTYPAYSFQTSNGMRWFFTTDKPANFGENTETGIFIYVDVNASNNKQQSQGAIENSPWTEGSFGGNDVVQDTFFVQINSDGKIVAIDSIGKKHLLEETDN